MMKIKSLVVVLFAFVGVYSSSASAFCFYPGVPSHGAQVAEYYDTSTDRFFLSWQEQATDFASCPPVGTLLQPSPTTSSFTGLAWQTLSSIDGCSLPGDLCALAKPLCRFRSDANREPESMFFTISEGECELLKRPDRDGPTSPITSRASSSITGRALPSHRGSRRSSAIQPPANVRRERFPSTASTTIDGRKGSATTGSSPTRP